MSLTVASMKTSLNNSPHTQQLFLPQSLQTESNAFDALILYHLKHMKTYEWYVLRVLFLLLQPIHQYPLFK